MNYRKPTIAEIKATSMEVGIDVAKEAIYLRGLFIHRYAAVEFAIAELVSRGFLHHAYSHLGNPPLGPAKKLKRLKTMIEINGPIAAYRSELQQRLDEFAQYAEYRNFMVHAIMVPAGRSNITFKLYDHREGVYSAGVLQLEFTDLRTITDLLSLLSVEFTSLVSKICRDIPLPAV